MTPPDPPDPRSSPRRGRTPATWSARWQVVCVPQRREAIVAGALPFVGQVPRSRDPSFRLQPVERRVERAGLYLQQVLGSPLDMFGDSVTMIRSCEQRAEDQQIERALQELHE